MKGFLSILISLTLLAIAGYIFYDNILPGCIRGVEYQIGEIDPAFEITPDEARQIALQASEIWNNAVGEEVLVYKEGSDFMIDFVFDTRQQVTHSRQQDETALASNRTDLDRVIAEYEELQQEYKQERTRYLANQDAYSKRLAKYNQDVEQANQNGASPAEYESLQQRQKNLDQEYRDLESDRKGLNSLVTQVNQANNAVNETVKKYNQLVQGFNEEYGSGETFDQGVYNLQGITIYQYNSQSDLLALLVHEFGHALGLDHVNDDQAVMYYLQHDAQESNIVLTEADLMELGTACNLSPKSFPKLF